MGLTQNQNESINNVLWCIYLKTKFCGLQKVILSVSQAITKFNAGAASRAIVLEAMGITPDRNMLTTLREEDNQRIYNATRNISSIIRLRRRKRRSEKKSGGKSVITYLAGGFGLSKVPEINISDPDNIDFTTSTTSQSIPITFIDENEVLIIRDYLSHFS